MPKVLTPKPHPKRQSSNVRTPARMACPIHPDSDPPERHPAAESALHLQQHANRRNAQHSTGPNPEGKAASAANSNHGLYGGTILSIEDDEDYNRSSRPPRLLPPRQFEALRRRDGRSTAPPPPRHAARNRLLITVSADNQRHLACPETAGRTRFFRGHPLLKNQPSSGDLVNLLWPLLRCHANERPQLCRAHPQEQPPPQLATGNPVSNSSSATSASRRPPSPTAAEPQAPSPRQSRPIQTRPHRPHAQLHPPRRARTQIAHRETYNQQHPAKTQGTNPFLRLGAKPRLPALQLPETVAPQAKPAKYGSPQERPARSAGRMRRAPRSRLLSQPH